MNFMEAYAQELQKEKAKLIESRTRKAKKVETKIVKEDTEEYLEPRFDSRASFYKKAKVVKKDNGDEELYSYGTHVGGVRGGKPYSKGKFSQTTTRHQKDYFQQRGFDPKEVETEGKKLEERDRSRTGIMQSIQDTIVPELDWVVDCSKDEGLVGLAELCEEYANALRDFNINNLEENKKEEAKNVKKIK